MKTFVVSQYQNKIELSKFIRNDDSIFISARGIYINRGYLETCSSNGIHQELSNAKGTLVNDQRPFIVFSKEFTDKGIPQQLRFPAEMIHIDSNNWVTHFVFDGNLPSADNDAEIEHPHHIEMVSPESKDQFVDKVRLILKNIEAGVVQKVVIARKLNVTADINIDSRLLVSELVKSQPESYIFSINKFVGASPELLVEKFSRSIRSLPMAGTRRRHARTDVDDADIADLQTNSKDRKEHLVVVEDIVRKLESISDNVTSSSTPHVVRLPHVSHLTTSISANASSEIDFLSIVDILHPTPAVAGTPLNQALEIINDIEGFDREIYGAPVGWFDSSGDGQCAIALRCAKIEENKATLFAGVGIVEESNPEAEWDETQAKFGVMRDSLMNIAQ